jgi:putative flippase GtrA
MTEFDLPSESAPPGPLIQLIRDQRVAFLVVGGINTAVAFVIFIGCSQSVGHLVEHGLGRVGAALVTLGLAHVLSVLFAFTMHRRFVFRVRGQVLRDLARFWSVYITAAGINFVALPVLVELGLHRISAQAIFIALTTLASYFGHRHFSFRRSPADAQGKTSGT